MPKKNHNIIVFFVKRGENVLWKFSNGRVSIAMDLNSKKKAPRTVKGAKNSFHYYAKKTGITNYNFAKKSDGIWANQEKLPI